MAFHDVTFPVNVAKGASGGPRWRTDIVTGVAGYEDRNSPWAHSRRTYTISVAPEEHQNREAVIAFFHGRRGQLYSFRFKDFTDFKSCAYTDTISNTDQDLGTGDGAETEFQLVKEYDGSGPAPYTRNITKPKNGTVVVALDGVAQTEGTHYSIDYTTGVITFNTAPGAGVSVTAGFEFDVPVRFDEDTLPATFLDKDISEYAQLRLIEVRE